MRGAILALAMLLLLAVAPATMGPAEAAAPATTVTIFGPEKLAVSGSGSFNVKIYGAADVKWAFFVNLSGAQRGSASMTSPEGKAGNNSYEMIEQAPLASPEFNFTLTAPSSAGSLGITVTAYASEGTAQHGVARWTVDVRAKREVTLNATVRNSGETPVANLKVAFYIHQSGEWKEIGNTTVQTIDGRSKANASLVWDSTLVDNGVHTIRMVVDPDHENPQYSGAENTVEFKVQLRTPGSALPKPVAPGVYVLAGIAIAAVIGGLYYYRKKKIV
jgi:hypothetical protein